MLKKTHTLAYIAAIANATIIGFSFMFTKNAVVVLKPIPMLFLRFSLAFIGIFLMFLLRFVKLDFKNKDFKKLIPLSLVNPVLYFILQSYGMQYATSTEGGILYAFMPIVVLIMSTFFLKEKTTLWQQFFIVLSVAGVIIMVAFNGNSSGSFRGVILLFLSVLSLSFANILVKKLSGQFTAAEMTFVMTGGAALILGVITVTFYGRYLFSENLYVLGDPDFLVAILYLGIPSSLMTFFLNNYSLSKLEASRAGIFLNMSTLVSIIAGVFIMKESFYIFQLLGALMIITGVIGANKKASSLKREPEEARWNL